MSDPAQPEPSHTGDGLGARAERFRTLYEMEFANLAGYCFMLVHDPDVYGALLPSSNVVPAMKIQKVRFIGSTGG